MDPITAQYQFRAGDDVIAADGDKVGTLADLHGTYLVVEKGFFFPRDYYIPHTMVSNYDSADGKIYLSVTKDAALNSGWDQIPDLTSETDTDTTTTASTGVADRTARGTTVTDQESMRIPVHEEELIPTKTVRQAGQVRVDKDVIEEDREIDVPVTEERVRVTRRAVDQTADTGDVSFQEESFEVPVRTEDVNVDKVVRVAEEIDIEKEAVQGTKRVSGTVRKERAKVDESGTDESIYADTDRFDETAST